MSFTPDREKRRVGVVLAVMPGPPTLISRLNVSGAPEDVAATGAPLRSGARFVEADLERAVADLAAGVAAAGHPRASVEPTVTPTDSERVDVGLAVQPGPRCFIGEAHLEGAASDMIGLAHRSIAFTEGRLYAPRLLRDARRNLRELDLFRRVTLVTDEPRGDVVDLLGDLTPRKPRTLEIDLGYWSDDFLRVGARWRHRNLLRGGRGGEVRGVLSRFRREGATSLWWPALLGPRTRVTWRVEVLREDEDSYDLDSEQTELWALKRIGDGGTVQGGITVADVRYVTLSSDADVFLAQDGLLTALHLRAGLERVDDPIDPSSGLTLSLRTEWSPPWLPTDNPFASVASELVAYRPLAGAVAVLRLEGGLAAPLGDAQDLLPNKRFFAGGSSSMRGARRRRLGPLDSDNDPVGGEALALATCELRVPLKGLVGRRALRGRRATCGGLAEDVALDDVAVAVGPGLSVLTPVGPVRLDVGLQPARATGGRARHPVAHLGRTPLLGERWRRA